VVGTTTLQPGQEAKLELRLYMGMHQGMGGQHQFAVDIRSNDPLVPLKTVVWRFNVVGDK
jgi:hypothetical protein